MLELKGVKNRNIYLYKDENDFHSLLGHHFSTSRRYIGFAGHEIEFFSFISTPAEGRIKGAFQN